MVHIKPKVTNPNFKPASYQEEGEMVILPFSLNCLQDISSLKLNNLPSELSSESTKQLICKTMKNVTSKPVPPLSIECNDVEAMKLKSQITDI